jgi:hypothetical protein
MRGSLVTRNTASAAGGIAKLGGTVVLRATTVTRNAPDNCEPAIPAAPANRLPAAHRSQ